MRIFFGAKSLLYINSFNRTPQPFCFKENINPSMEDKNEEFEPLFDYTRVQPRDIVCLDDDSEDASPVIFSKRRKISDAEAAKKVAGASVKDSKVVNLDKEEDEEDWLPPPPKSLIDSDKTLEEGSTLKALRLKKQELASFAQSAEELVQAVEESVRKNLHASLQYSPQNATKKTLEPPPERTKLVISIQDKDGLKQFRVFMVASNYTRAERCLCIAGGVKYLNLFNKVACRSTKVF
ncbi:uncharacterized protein [Primulina huaijiensis]|uniref:uncharacterized protein isoform X3 n=1 Tax=Primulina huaijiensis TaxID=1492673 RepID=UPI003CC6F5B6